MSNIMKHALDMHRNSIVHRARVLETAFSKASPPEPWRRDAGQRTLEQSWTQMTQPVPAELPDGELPPLSIELH